MDSQKKDSQTKDSQTKDSEPQVNSEPCTASSQNVEPNGGISESTYLSERTLLIEIEQKSAAQHDKAILTVASGGLALSLTFLKEIAPHPLPETWKYIGISWACFVLSILTILLSFNKPISLP